MIANGPSEEKVAGSAAAGSHAIAAANPRSACGDLLNSVLEGDKTQWEMYLSEIYNVSYSTGDDEDDEIPPEKLRNASKEIGRPHTGNRLRI